MGAGHPAVDVDRKPGQRTPPGVDAAGLPPRPQPGPRAPPDHAHRRPEPGGAEGRSGEVAPRTLPLTGRTKDGARMTKEIRIPKSEIRSPKFEIRNPNRNRPVADAPSAFELGASSFFRHSCFVLRHFPHRGLTAGITS